MIACICGGILEMPLLYMAAVPVVGSAIAFIRYHLHKHGVHGDQNCECQCHSELDAEDAINALRGTVDVLVRARLLCLLVYLLLLLFSYNKHLLCQ